MAICRKCGKNELEIQGFLKRMNQTGVDGIWECRPACGAEMSPDDAVVAAIMDDEDFDFQEGVKQAEKLYVEGYFQGDLSKMQGIWCNFDHGHCYVGTLEEAGKQSEEFQKYLDNNPENRQAPVPQPRKISREEALRFSDLALKEAEKAAQKRKEMLDGKPE